MSPPSRAENPPILTPGQPHGLDVAEDRRVPLQRVPLVAGEDFLAAVSGHLHVRDEEELPKGGVEGEALHAGAEGDDELRRGAVHAVAGDDDLRTGAEDVGLCVPLPCTATPHALWGLGSG